MVGVVRTDDGAPGTSAADRSTLTEATSSATSTTEIVMAPCGQPWTHAGASPSASRSLQRSHLRTMPRSALNVGTS